MLCNYGLENVKTKNVFWDKNNKEFMLRTRSLLAESISIYLICARNVSDITCTHIAHTIRTQTQTLTHHHSNS